MGVVDWGPREESEKEGQANRRQVCDRIGTRSKFGGMMIFLGERSGPLRLFGAPKLDTLFRALLGAVTELGAAPSCK